MQPSPDIHEQLVIAPSAEDVRRFINAAWDDDPKGIHAFLDKFGEGQIAVTKGEPIAWTALHWAAKSGATNSLKALLARGAEIDKLDAHGSTPLMIAAQHGKPLTVAALLASGADVEKCDAQGKTPADIAAKANYPDIAAAVGRLADAREKARLDAALAAEEALRAKASAFQENMRATAKVVRLRPKGRGPS